jgi:hypothetical protein
MVMRPRAVQVLVGVGLTAVVGGLVAWQLHVPNPSNIHGGLSVAAIAPAPASPSTVVGSSPPPTPPTPAAAPSRPAAPGHPPPPPNPGQTRRFEVTLYGALDNDPPGSSDIAYPTVHRQAGGTGTFRDPVTFATSRAELPVGTVVYYPFLKRYFVMEDQCVECEQEWNSRKFPHIDLWAGDATDDGIIDCEDALTQDGQVAVVVHPAANLPVDTTPLYAAGRCYQPG